MNVAPDDPPPARVPSLVPGVLLGGAIGGGLLGATDAIVAAAAAGQDTAIRTVLLCSVVWTLGGAAIALPWALFLRWSSLSTRPALLDNPRWWGVHVGAGGAALAFVWADLGTKQALLAAAPLLLCCAALSMLLETSRSRIFGMTGMLAMLSIWSVVQQRDKPSSWPEGTVRSVLLVTVDGLRSSDLDNLPSDGTWARWRAGGTTYRRLVLPSEDPSLALRSLWRGEASWATGGLRATPMATAATQLAKLGWGVEGHLGASDTEDPGLTRRSETHDWVPLWRETRTGRLLGAQATRTPARRVVASAEADVGTKTARPKLLWVHLADVRFPWTPPPPWDTAFYDGDPWDPAEGTSLPPEATAIWPNVSDPAWITAQRAGALASMDDALESLANAVPSDGTWAVVAVGTAGAQPFPPDTTSLDACTGAVLLWAPGALPAGAVVEAPVEASTLAGTLLDLAGAPGEEAGQTSLVPLAFGRRAPPFARTSRAGVPIVISGDLVWEESEGDPPSAEWRIAAQQVAKSIP